MGDEEDREAHRRARPGLIDATVPNAARAANYLDGGQGHFAADREVVRAATASVPATSRIPAETGAFRHRVLRYLAVEAGLRDFLHIGVGLIPSGVTHEIVQAVDPSCRIHYTESDHTVLAQARAGMTSAPQGVVRCDSGDIADVDAILADAKATLDLSRPTAVLLMPTLSRVPTLVAAARTVAALMAAVPSGSHVAICHLASDLDPAVPAAARAWNKTLAAPIIPRTRADVQALVAGLEIVEPGVVPVAEWRPDPDAGPAVLVPLHGVVARKP
jgi:hypothetical protein